MMRTHSRFLGLVPLLTLAACSGDPRDTTPAELEEFAAGYTAAWSSQDAASVAGFYSPNGSLRINDGEPSVGRAALTATARSFMTALPDLALVMDSLGRAGDRVIYHWTLTGTNTGPGGTGNPVHISGFEEWRFGPDGLIADSRGHMDEAEYARQLREGASTLALPRWNFDSAMIFPSSGTLSRPEDGVALADGSLLVVDQVHGLRRIDPDGSSAPFGGMVAAGYLHAPPEHPGGANGISLEPDGTHVLVADVFHGGIYRVDVVTGEAERVYAHTYGVNTAVRDSRGAIWFTQSAQNTPEEGEARMWANVDVPAPEGALLRLGMEDGAFSDRAEVRVDSLFFANGVVLDEPGGHLYLAETLGGRVHRFAVDWDEGRLSDPTVVVEGVAPDNLELDGAGRLWIALPLANELLVVDTKTGTRHTAFRSRTPEQEEIHAEFQRRGESGTPRMELLTPELWTPLPGLLTGVILSPDGGPVYLSGLGNALVKLER